MELIKKFIFQQVASKQINAEDAAKMLMEIKNSAKREEDIAIIGMACRFPEANSTEEYWNTIKNKVNCIRSFPPNRRKDIDKLLAQYLSIDDISSMGDMYSKGGFMDEIDKFDPFFFRISPREARLMDPWQRIFLEIAWEAMEEAGYGGDKLSGTNTGVYVGRDHTNDSVYKRFVDEKDALVATGSWAGILAGRVSYIFNLCGPSVVVDTACSSGLVAVHEACEALKNKECDMALAGGIHVAFTPLKDGQISIVESDDFVVKTFDKNANGTVWGEGAGAVLLKPLSKAIEDGDNIYAVIKGTAINNDGTTNGITAPSAEAQEKVLLKAWKEARIHPETINYIETHGTGTVLGDPIEIKGLNAAFGKYTDKKQFCAIGSVKPSIGHLVAASGISSLFKVTLALKNQMIPPTINFEEPNPYINFLDSPVYVSDQLKEWKKGGTEPRRAGVSAFGFSGTNCHIVLEEAPQIEKETAITEETYEILSLSARNKETLKNLITKYNTYFEEHPSIHLSDLCYTANTGRGHYTSRMAIIVNGIQDLKEKMEQLQSVDFDAFKVDWFFYGEHRVVGSSKKEKEDGEITEEERRELSRLGNLKITESLDPKRTFKALEEICKLYLRGAELDWASLYANQKRRRISLPVYPLERVRYWVEPSTQTPVNKATTAAKEISHPLLDRCVADSLYQDIFVTEFKVERHWVLRDHKVMGNYVIPGTTYLELVREASSKHYPGGKIRLQDVVFLAPLMVNEDEVKEVHTIFNKEEGYLAFTVASKNEDDGTWSKHALGKIYELDDPQTHSYDIAELKKPFGEPVTIKLSESSNAQAGNPFEFGPRWWATQKVSINEAGNQVWIELEIPEELQGDLQEFVLHPSLLDLAVNVAIRSVGEGLYLPLSYKNFALYGSMPAKFFGNVRKKEKETESKETFSFDITLMDLDGNVFAEITEYTIKKVRQAELKFANQVNLYHQLSWVEKELTTEGGNDLKGAILIFKDRRGLSTEIIDRLKSGENEIIEVELGSEYQKLDSNQYIISAAEEDYDKLIADVKQKDIAQILHLLSITDAQEIDELTQLTTEQNYGVYSLFNLTRALIRQKITQNLEIVIISNHANKVTVSDQTTYPLHAALFGFGKAIGQENQNLRCRSIDVDHLTSADRLIAEIQASATTYQVAYRANQRYVEELRKVKLDQVEAAEVEIRDTGVYLITGGTGGIGLEMCKYLAEKCKVNIALLNRSALPERAEWGEILAKAEDARLCAKLQGIMEIESKGATVVCCSVDVTNLEEMKAVLTQLREEYGRINGIIHSAGIAGDGFIALKEKKILEKVLAPKIQGTWVLDQLTKEDDVDFIALCSSITAILGGPGQADYTAANAYLDAYAAGSEKRVISINWAPWKETGMAVQYGVDMDNGIFKAITTDRAINGFDLVVNKKMANVILGELNYKHPVFKDVNQFPLAISADLKAEIEKVTKHAKVESKPKDKLQFTEVSIKGRSSNQYTETETKLAQVWSQILGLNEVNIYDDFYQMGGDSIQAIKITNIATEYLGMEVALSDLFEYITIAELAKHLDEQSKENATPTAARTGETPESSVYDLTNAQRSLWFLQKSNPEMTVYNLQGTFPIRMYEPDIAKIQEIVNTLIRRHDALRTIFIEEDGIPKQTVLEQMELPLEVVDFTNEEQTEDLWKNKIIGMNRIPFDLSKPLVRAKLYRLSPDKHYLYMDFHHMISDGWSIKVVYEELAEMFDAYENQRKNNLPPVKRSYSDWVQEQNTWIQSPECKQVEDYWLQELAKPLPELNLPIDYPRPEKLTKHGHYYVYQIDREMTKKLKDLNKKLNTTPHVMLLSAYALLLNKITADQNLIIGIPITGRDKMDLENVIGLFVNTLCIRIDFSTVTTFKELVNQVKDKSVQGYKNSKYPFDLLVKKVNPERNPGRNPIYSTLFQYYEMIPLEDEQASIFELCLACREDNGEIQVRIEYNVDLFKESTIAKIAQNYAEVLNQILDNENVPIKDVEFDADYTVLESINDLDFVF